MNPLDFEGSDSYHFSVCVCVCGGGGEGGADKRNGM